MCLKNVTDFCHLLFEYLKPLCILWILEKSKIYRNGLALGLYCTHEHLCFWQLARLPPEMSNVYIISITFELIPKEGPVGKS